MKHITLFLLLTGFSLLATAQTHKVTVFCNVAVSGHINYNKAAYALFTENLKNIEKNKTPEVTPGSM